MGEEGVMGRATASVDLSQIPLYAFEMASDPKFVERTLERLLPLDVDARKMFGEYGLFYKGKMFGLICGNTFFIRVTSLGAEIAGRIGKGFPYPGAKPAFKISNIKANDSKWLKQLVEVTPQELPEPKKKKKSH